MSNMSSKNGRAGNGTFGNLDSKLLMKILVWITINVTDMSSMYVSIKISHGQTAHSFEYVQMQLISMDSNMGGGASTVEIDA